MALSMDSNDHCQTQAQDCEQSCHPNPSVRRGRYRSLGRGLDLQPTRRGIVGGAL